jgi:hypothetical protein
MLEHSFDQVAAENMPLHDLAGTFMDNVLWESSQLLIKATDRPLTFLVHSPAHPFDQISLEFSE